MEIPFNPQPPHDVTQILKDWSEGSEDASARLMPLVYEELRRLARYYMNHQRPGHTLQTTALVNEAYLRLVGTGEGAATVSVFGATGSGLATSLGHSV